MATHRCPALSNVSAVLHGAGKLLVSNTYGASLTEYPVTASGDTAPARTISGSATGLAFPHAVDVDATGNIYVANEFTGLTEYAAAASGNVAPLFSVGGTNTGLRGPEGIAVAPPLSVRTAKLKAARVGHRYRVRLRANLGTTPYRWSIKHGKLPRGLHLKRSGTLTGRPRHKGTYHFTVRVRDASHPAMRASQALVLRVR